MFAGLKHIWTPDVFEPYGHFRNNSYKIGILFPKIKNIFYEKPDFDDQFLLEKTWFSLGFNPSLLFKGRQEFSYRVSAWSPYTFL